MKLLSFCIPTSSEFVDYSFIFFLFAYDILKTIKILMKATKSTSYIMVTLGIGDFDIVFTTRVITI
jgi:hypothetical protein